MASSSLLVFLLLSSFLFHTCFGARTLAALVEKQPLALAYHNGPLLAGPVSVNLVWYGKFTATQRSIVSDFVTSLSSSSSGDHRNQPSVSTWWQTVEKYYSTSNGEKPVITLADQTLDDSYSLGKSLRDSDIVQLAAARGARAGAGPTARPPPARPGRPTSGSGTPRPGVPARARGRSTGRPTGPSPRRWWRPTATSASTGWWSTWRDSSPAPSRIRSAAGSSRGRRRPRWRRRPRVRGSTGRARTPDTPGSCWWTRRVGPATMLVGPAGGSTWSRLWSTRRRPLVLRWFDGFGNGRVALLCLICIYTVYVYFLMCVIVF
ncbi:putative protein EXORDIUM [Iris pallida]|uniref:Uncharacterized protein n=1 Tax=Iris pallida TaxID=29817 RepID=A0AAX6FEP4_IRIPA|nr:putative protein EXORDIUM [Iris pallida]